MEQTPTDKAAIAKYKQDSEFLYRMTPNDITRLVNHGNPALRKVGAALAEMDERYDRGEGNRIKDAQTIDDVLSIATMDQIRAAVAR